ncbi:hypothetical protein L6452_40937 [Arctium lappa]|uniref:Uncharacterized protein n=1 Tax=Arctium lappa TaxID=4217 RepID=A0ACB8XNU7_ARCLA|nr:hypothetical protein L6452_40937 [Arctium lappa]
MERSILRWRLFRDLTDLEENNLHRPSDFTVESPYRCNITTTTATTTTSAGTPRSSWCDSDFTVGDSPVWCCGFSRSSSVAKRKREKTVEREENEKQGKRRKLIKKKQPTQAKSIRLGLTQLFGEDIQKTGETGEKEASAVILSQPSFNLGLTQLFGEDIQKTGEVVTKKVVAEKAVAEKAVTEKDCTCG